MKKMDWKKKLAMAVTIGIMGVTCHISYAAEVPVIMFQETTAQNIQDSSEYKKVNIKVKAEVTEGFSDKIQISYLGMNGNEFSVVLSPENKYTSCISVVQDYYTLKELYTPSEVDMEVAKRISFVNVNPKKTYYLPVSVYQSTIAAENKLPCIHVKVSAGKNPGNLGYKGDIIMKYAGTNGNEFHVLLNDLNGYTQEIDIAKDIYTIEEISLEKGYVGDAIYSFDVTKASKEITYELDIALQKKKLEMETTSVKEEKPLIEENDVEISSPTLDSITKEIERNIKIQESSFIWNISMLVGGVLTGSIIGMAIATIKKKRRKGE